MYIYTTKRDQLNPLFTDLLSVDTVSLDLETNKLDPFMADLLLLQLEVNTNLYVLNVRNLGKEIIKYLISLIKETNKRVIGHNIKFDVKILKVYTGELLTNTWDTMLAEILIYQGIGNRFPSLDSLVSKYCKVSLDKEVRKSFIDYTGEITESQVLYGALDVKYLRSIFEQQLEILKSQKQLNILELECNLIPVFADIELEGLLLDEQIWLAAEQKAKDHLVEYKDKILNLMLDNLDLSTCKNLLELTTKLSIPVITKKEQKLLETISDFSLSRAWLFEKINLNSPLQIKTILNLLGFQVNSTGEEVLRDYRQPENIIDYILKYREEEKSISTYGTNFLNHISPITERIHTELNQLGAATGRVSSNNPNLQNIKRESAYRSAFISKPGHKLITADYNQAELRLLGSVSQELEFIKTYQEDKDLHTTTASFLFNKDISEVTKAERFIGKTMNFAIFYGISEWGLKRNLGLDLEVGRNYITKFFESYKYIKAFIDLVGERIWKVKYSITPYGRKRFFEDKVLFTDFKDELKYQSKVKREGINHICQGGVADIVKLAMLAIFRDNPFGEDLKILLQVHDEIICEVKSEYAEQAKEFIEQCMLKAEQPFLKGISAVVDINIANCWKH